MSNEIARTEARRDFIASMIKETKGRFFTVHFYKKDGSLRKMTARTGVRKGTNGGVNTTAHLSKYVTLWCSAARQHRNVNLDEIVWMKVQGVGFVVTMDEF